jgi:nucleoside-diphosphate-sugar epimerase
LNTDSDVLIIGCGDIGVRVARRLQQTGARVAGLARSAESASRLQRFDITPVPGDLDDADSLAGLPTGERLIFYFAPPPGGGTKDTRMRRFCRAVGPDQTPSRVVYISTSGVYGDCGGEWVTEETPVNPQTSRAQRRLDAETVLQEWGRRCRVSVVILRVTGIYGPGRLPLARLQQGQPVLRVQEAPPTNRIHADDLATVCLAAAEHGEDGDIFNVSDGNPGTMTEYFIAIADLFDLPRPQQVDLAEARRGMNPMMLSYLQESRRMRSHKMIEKLGITLQYPDLETGLKQVAAQMDQPNMGYLGSIGH